MPEDCEAPEQLLAIVPMVLFSTSPCQLPLPEPSLMLMAPPWMVPLIVLFETLKSTISVLSTNGSGGHRPEAGQADPPEIVMPWPSALPPPPPEIVLPVITTCSLAV